MIQTNIISRAPAGVAAALLIALLSLPAYAQQQGTGPHDGQTDAAGQTDHSGHGDASAHAGAAGHGDILRADNVAPIGVMGDHLLHRAGQWMLSYRYMRMDMNGSRDGTTSLSPDTIVTEVPNRFFGMPGQPPTLRIVPLDMSMGMHMVGAMYGASKVLTVTAMASYVTKEMRHRTYQGGMGTNVLGTFTTETSGFGDARIGVLYRLSSTAVHRFHLNLALSLPTGGITETDTILTPMNTRPTVRVPYAMQLGTGTYDLMPGLTYTGLKGNLSWGAQLRSEIRLENDNGEGYSWGDVYGLTGWLATAWADWISTSVRLDGWTQSAISGMDPNIVGPVQTANPDFYGGDQIYAYLGVNTAGQKGWVRGQQLGLEIGFPLYRSLNGPQLETDWKVVLGWRTIF